MLQMAFVCACMRACVHACVCHSLFSFIEWNDTPYAAVHVRKKTPYAFY